MEYFEASDDDDSRSHFKFESSTFLTNSISFSRARNDKFQLQFIQRRIKVVGDQSTFVN